MYKVSVQYRIVFELSLIPSNGLAVLISWSYGESVYHGELFAIFQAAVRFSLTVHFPGKVSGWWDGSILLGSWRAARD